MHKSLVLLSLVLALVANAGLQFHEADIHPVGVGLGAPTTHVVVDHAEPLTTLHLESAISVRILDCPACAAHHQPRGSQLPNFGHDLKPDTGSTLRAQNQSAALPAGLLI